MLEGIKTEAWRVGYNFIYLVSLAMGQFGRIRPLAQPHVSVYGNCLKTSEGVHRRILKVYSLDFRFSRHSFLYGNNPMHKGIREVDFGYSQ